MKFSNDGNKAVIYKVYFKYYVRHKSVSWKKLSGVLYPLIFCPVNFIFIFFIFARVHSCGSGSASKACRCEPGWFRLVGNKNLYNLVNSFLLGGHKLFILFWITHLKMILKSCRPTTLLFSSPFNLEIKYSTFILFQDLIF